MPQSIDSVDQAQGAASRRNGESCVKVMPNHENMHARNKHMMRSEQVWPTRLLMPYFGKGLRNNGRVGSHYRSTSRLQPTSDATPYKLAISSRLVRGVRMTCRHWCHDENRRADDSWHHWRRLAFHLGHASSEFSKTVQMKGWLSRA
jgi:hypothetical protein